MDDYDRRKEDLEVRDAAVRAETKIDGHIQDCAKWRESVQKGFIDLRTDNRELRDDNKTLARNMTLIIGGLIGLSKAADLIGPFFHSMKP